MPPAGYPAFLQYPQSGRVRKKELLALSNSQATLAPWRAEGAFVFREPMKSKKSRKSE